MTLIRSYRYTALTVAALALLASTAVPALATGDAALSMQSDATLSVRSEVPEYDRIDPQTLRDRSGFIGLGVGEEVTEDNLLRYGTDMVPGSVEPTDEIDSPNTGMTGQAGASGPVSPSMPAPEMNNDMSAATGMNTVQPALDPSVTVYDPAAPAPQGQQSIQQQGVQAMMTPADVVVETHIVGNTDTGVNMNRVEQALEGEVSVSPQYPSQQQVLRAPAGAVMAQ